MHRNTYLQFARSCSTGITACSATRASAFAGQMTGVEGYVESARVRLCSPASRRRAQLLGRPPVDFPRETAIGALGLYMSERHDGRRFPADERQFRHHRRRSAAACKGKRNKNAELSPRAGDHRQPARERPQRRKGGITAMKIIVDAMGGDFAPEDIRPRRAARAQRNTARTSFSSAARRTSCASWMKAGLAMRSRQGIEIANAERGRGRSDDDPSDGLHAARRILP